jgi:MFS family permease
VASKLGSDFGKLTWAAGISNIGDGVMGAAFPLLVASLTRDPVLVAGAAVAGRLPWFLFALISGALADRMDRKRVLIITDLMRAVGVGLLALGVWTGEVGLVAVYLVAFGLGIAETFFDTSAEAFIPRLVADEHLPSANGRLQAVEWVGGAFAGPPLGALLFATAASLPFLVDAVSFALAALMIALIPGPHRSTRTVQGTLWADIKAGLGWLWRQRLLRALVLMAGVINLVTLGITSIFVLYAQDILGVVDIGYGILLSAIGVGGLIGALVSPWIVRTIGPGNTLRYVVTSSAVLTGIFPFLGDLWAAGVIMLLFGLTANGWNVVSVSLRQKLTPDELRARVAGAARLLAFGTQPAGALLGGALGATLGLRSPFWAAAAVFTVMLVVTWQITSNQTIRAAETAGIATAP